MKEGDEALGLGGSSPDSTDLSSLSAQFCSSPFTGFSGSLFLASMFLWCCSLTKLHNSMISSSFSLELSQRIS